MTAIPIVDPIAYGRLKQEVLSAATESALPGWAKSLFQQAYEMIDALGVTALVEQTASSFAIGGRSPTVMGTKNWEVG